MLLSKGIEVRSTLVKEWKFLVSIFVALFGILCICWELSNIRASVDELRDWVAAMTDDTTEMGIASEKLRELLEEILEERHAPRSLQSDSDNGTESTAAVLSNEGFEMSPPSDREELCVFSDILLY